jgi:hypothetical protein
MSLTENVRRRASIPSRHRDKISTDYSKKVGPKKRDIVHGNPAIRQIKRFVLKSADRIQEQCRPQQTGSSAATRQLLVMAKLGLELIYRWATGKDNACWLAYSLI